MGGPRSANLDAAGMIDMGGEYLFQLHAALFDGAQDIVEIATRVDDGGLLDVVHQRMEQFCRCGDWTTVPRRPVSGCCSSLIIVGAIAQEALPAQAL